MLSLTVFAAACLESFILQKKKHLGKSFSQTLKKLIFIHHRQRQLSKRLKRRHHLPTGRSSVRIVLSCQLELA